MPPHSAMTNGHNNNLSGMEVERGPSVLKGPGDGPVSREIIASYTVTFFFAMIAHELALEAATSDPEFKDLDCLPYAVTLFQFGFCVLLPVMVSRGEAIQRFPSLRRDPSEFYPYIKLSVVVFGATGVSSMALRYVTYPTKVIFKSAKLIPTMIVSTLFHSKKYSVLEYVAALLLCMGAAGYSIGPGGNDQDRNDQWQGIALLLISVLCDAIVPNLQQSLMAPTASSSGPVPSANNNNSSNSNKQLTAAELMVNTNAVGFIGLLFYTQMAGHLVPAITAFIQHPRLVVYLTFVGMGLGCAVLAYTRLIKASGSVVAVAVATLRKVVTMVLSYLVFPKPFSRIHVLSGLLVLAGIFLSTHAKERKHQQ